MPHQEDTGTPFLVTIISYSCRISCPDFKFLQVLVRRFEQAPFSETAETAGHIIASRIANRTLQCDRATVNRIFHLFKLQRPSGLLVGIENGNIPLFSSASRSQFGYDSTWECLRVLANRCTAAEEPIRDAFVAHLDTICRWFQVMIDMVYFQPEATSTTSTGLIFPPALRTRICATITAVLLGIMTADQITIEPKVCSDPRMIKIITKVWISKAIYPNNFPLLGPTQLFDRCIVYYASMPGDDCDEHIVQAFDEIEVDYDFVASVALGYLHESVHSQEWDLNGVFTNLEILQFLYRRIQPLKEPFLENDIGTLVLKVLQRVTDVLEERDSGPDEPHCQVLGYSVVLLYQIAHEGDTIPWVVQWIQGDLLFMLLQCDPWMKNLMNLEPRFAQVIIMFLSEFFPRLCVFKSFVTPLARELAALEEAGIGIDLSNYFLRHAMPVLKTLARAQADTVYDLRYLPVFLYRVCEGRGVSNPFLLFFIDSHVVLQCDARDDAYRFRRCQGCLSHYYCSAECQRSDWPSHREECQDLQLTLSGKQNCYYYLILLTSFLVPTSDYSRKDISSSDLRSLKKQVSCQLARMWLEPRYHDQIEQSTHTTVHISIRYKEPPLDVSVEILENRHPFLSISVTVHRGELTRDLKFATTLQELLRRHREYS